MIMTCQDKLAMIMTGQDKLAVIMTGQGKLAMMRGSSKHCTIAQLHHQQSTWQQSQQSLLLMAMSWDQ